METLGVSWQGAGDQGGKNRNVIYLLVYLEEFLLVVLVPFDS